MHDGMPHDPIQGQGHECFKVTRGVDCQFRTGLIFMADVTVTDVMIVYSTAPLLDAMFE